ncbi:hypothetical protein [Fodinibius sp. Rm-B-1B1-1]|uniref:hypothetical protein n=1 Tax=Fodinibius alkaliphilus TaxID=3140241 RepID=UPI00315A6522
MKQLLFSLALCFVVFASSFGQAPENNYRKIDYLDIDQSQIDKFVQVTQKDFKASFNTLLESGGIKSWCLYKVKLPGGEESDYNFVSITTSSSIGALGNHFSKATSPGFIPSDVPSDAQRQLSKLATLVKSEIWKIENSAYADTGSTPSRYMTMDYMNVATGKDPDYLMLEDEIAKPIHLERIERDQMAGWEVYALILPGGMNYGYNFATGNHFAKLEHFEFGFDQEIIRQTMGENSNVPELFETIYNTRDLVKVELWELVDHLK